MLFLHRYLSYTRFLALLCFVCIAHGCTSEPGPESEKHHEQEMVAPETVQLTHRQIETIGIQTGSMIMADIRNTIKASGFLKLPPQNSASVSVFVGGIVRSISVVEGTYVHKGQILATLASPEYVRIQQEYLQTEARIMYLEQELARQKELAQGDINAKKQLQQATSEYTVSKSGLNGLAKSVELLGISLDALRRGTISETIPLRAPIDGYIKSVHGNIGVFVEPNSRLFEIVDNRHLHIDLNVFEKDVFKVHQGQTVRFRLNREDSEEMQATVFAIGKSIENESKSITVHAELQNRDERLLPGMYVSAYIILGHNDVPALPQEAIIKDGALTYLFIQLDETHSSPTGNHADEHEVVFRRMEVKTGASDGGKVEVTLLEALPAEAKIVVKGAFYLMAQMKKDAGGEEEHGH